VVGIIVACAWGFRCLQNSDDPPRLIFKWLISVGVIVGGLRFMYGFPPQFWPVIVLIPAITIGLMWASSIGAMVAKPLTSSFDGGDQEVDPQPFYSVAESKRHNGFYDESILEIRAQLEKFPGDFKGMMLMASIQADNLNNLSGAQQIIEELLQQPNLPPQAAATALNSLADWQLQLAHDTEAARATVQRITDAYPDTQLSLLAAQRSARMANSEEVQDARQQRKFIVREREHDIGLRPAGHGETTGPDCAKLAEGYVKQLELHPLDSDTREKLALLYADHFKRLDLALEQLEQLISFPHQSTRHVARWLNLIASLHIRFGGDIAAAEQSLRRIIEQFPKTALADAAESRLPYLGMELKGGQQAGTKSLGSYEKNIGLKPATEC